MYLMSMKVSDCDFTGETFSVPVDGAGLVARGATGRWCVVMTMGPGEIYRTKADPQSEDDVRSKIEEQGEWLDY